jgi:4-amino-4-deoxy-L-arabinose transferase-like glycosyltransferase
VRLSRAAIACALVAFLNAVAWVALTPPFHVPDEPQHLAYAQYLAETGKLPRQVPRAVFSGEEAAAAAGLRLNAVVGNPSGKPPWTDAEGRALDGTLRAPLPRRSEGGGSNTTNNPPLYYALGAVPYHAASSGTLLDRLYAMRLVSALLAAATAIFVFLFLAELLPGTPWAWPVGALAVAVQPLFGFMSGGFNNDDLLFTTAAATFWLLARGFRRGLTPRLGVALGAAVGLGMVAKANTVGLLPGVALAVAFMVWQRRGEDRRPALLGAATAAAVAAVPVVAYVVLDLTVWGRPIWGGVGTTSGTAATASPHVYPFKEFLSYAWQFYFPRLPFLHDQFGTYPLWETWFKGFIARFGWLDYGFPDWAYWVALGIVVPVLVLAGAALGRARSSVRRRWPELASYAAMMAGLLLLIAIAGFRGRIDNGSVFEQARYLLPLLPLYGAIVALAARGAGRRWGPAVGAVFVVAALGHDVFAQLATLARYYA